jgi:serine/threonine-protein kinase RsbT
VSSPFYLAITSQSDVEEARRQTRAIVLALGFRLSDAEAVVLAVSELATNLLRYGQNGRISVDSIKAGPRFGVVVESIDSGPGIADIERALADGFSTSDGLGSGLPAVRRLMDEFDIATGLQGTYITARKWL